MAFLLLSRWAKRDSNPRPSACKADALNQLRYSPDGPRIAEKRCKITSNFENAKKNDGKFSYYSHFSYFCTHKQAPNVLGRQRLTQQNGKKPRCGKVPPYGDMLSTYRDMKKEKKFFEKGKIGVDKVKQIKDITNSLWI